MRVEQLTTDQVGYILRPYGYSFYGYENGEELWMDDRGRVRTRADAVAWCTGIGLEQHDEQ